MTLREVCAATCQQGLDMEEKGRFPAKNVMAAKCYTCPAHLSFAAHICPKGAVSPKDDEGACWTPLDRLSTCVGFKAHCGKDAYVNYSDKDGRKRKSLLDDMCPRTCYDQKREPHLGATRWLHQDALLAKNYITTF